MKKGQPRTLCAILLISLGMSAVAQAADTSEQESRIARLEAQLAAIQQELTALKSQLSQPAPIAAAADEQTIHAAVERAVEKKMADQPKIPDWISRVKIGGDLRFRNEWTDDATAADDRNRLRIQARIGIYGTVNEEIDYGFRVASGNSESPLRDEGSPTSNNQDLGNAFSSKNIWMDLGYFDYHPRRIGGLNILGGKILNPYYTVGNSDLMFDSDVTPEGIAATYKSRFSERVQVFAAAGGFTVRERTSDAETSLWGLQGGTTFQFGQEKKSNVTLGAGYYNYGNVRGKKGLGTDETQFYGNTSVGGVYACDFDLVQGFAELGVPAGGRPLRLFGDYICNTQSRSRQDTAYLIGAALGQCKDPGSWELSYNYRKLEADSVLGVLSEATFGGGGTNLEGHRFGLKYQLAANTQLGATYMLAERTRNGEKRDYDVGMVDVTVKY